MNLLHDCGIGKRKFLKFVDAINHGQLAPPDDGRSMRHARDVPKTDHARSFFQFLYDHLAEPLAEGDPGPEPEAELELHDEFIYFTRGEAAQNPAASALGTLQSGLPQKCFGRNF